MANRISFSGQLRSRGVLRSTPAGVPVIEFALEHRSEQIEAGIQRGVECEMNCVVLGPLANLLNVAHLGAEVVVEGFLAARSLKNRTPVLHVTKIEYQEGQENGFQTEERK